MTSQPTAKSCIASTQSGESVAQPRTLGGTYPVLAWSLIEDIDGNQSAIAESRGQSRMIAQLQLLSKPEETRLFQNTASNRLLDNA